MLANEIAETADFNETVQYNLFGKKAEPNPDKCAWYVTRNLHSDDLEVGTKIMQATAAQSKAVTCCYHFSLDWHVDETDNLTSEKAIAAADTVLKKLGLEENQAMYFWHTDADHPHMHVVVNRAVEHADGIVRAHDMWKSKERLERSVFEVANEMGFEAIEGRHNSKDFEPDRDKGAPQSKRDLVHTDELVPWVREDVQRVKSRFWQSFNAANNWAELAEGLEKDGLSLRQKGQGLIVHDGQKFTPISKLGKDVRLKKMEQDYGQTFAEFSDKQMLETEQEQEELQEWAEDGDAVFEEIDEPENLEKLQKLLGIMDELAKFDKSQTVQRATKALAKAQKTADRREWLIGKAEASVEYHEQAFTDILTHITHDPNAAIKATEELKKDNKLTRALKAGRRKFPEWRKAIDGALKRHKKKVKQRKSERELERERREEERIFYRMQKLREAENKLAERKRQRAFSQAELVRKKFGFKKTREMKLRFEDLKKFAARDLTQKMIFTSELSVPQKKRLFAQFERNRDKAPKLGQTRGGDRDRSDGGWEL